MDRYLLELDAGTRDRLERLKEHPEEPYSRIINRLIDDYEDDSSLTRDEVEEIRQALRDLKEGRFVPGPQVKSDPAPVMGEWFVPAAEPAPVPETPRSSIGDPQAVKDMETLFSGTATQEAPFPGTSKMAHDDPDIARYRSVDDGTVDIHEIDPYDKRGRARTSYLDSL